MDHQHKGSHEKETKDNVALQNAANQRTVVKTSNVCHHGVANQVKDA